MANEFDFKNHPELTDAQMAEFYWLSPHKQINEDFRARVVQVHDGDTITVQWDERDFDFPIRLALINAPELNERLGHSSGDWLRTLLLGEMVDIIINKKNRVDKYGRLIGEIFHRGMNINQVLVMMGRATPFWQQDEGQIPEIEERIKPIEAIFT